MKKSIFAVLLALTLLLCACGKAVENAPTLPAEVPTQSSAVKASENASKPLEDPAAEQTPPQAEQQTKKDEVKEVKKEEEDEQARKAAEEAAKQATDEAAQKAADEAAKKAADDAAQKAADEAAKKAAEEAAQKAADEAAKKSAEEAAQKAADEAAKKAAEEAAAATQNTCTISIDCLTILDNMDNLEDGKESCVPGNGYILSSRTVSFTEGETVFDVLQRVCQDNGIQMEASWTPAYNSYYIEGINNLYEFDCGSESGWMYSVDGWFPNYGCSSYTLDPGETICWRYTCNGLGADIGGGM